MGNSSSSGSKDTGPRKARLSEQLRANLQRRKAQARSRRGGKADERRDGIDASDGSRQRSPREDGR
jgi:hypothetical protein